MQTVTLNPLFLLLSGFLPALFDILIGLFLSILSGCLYSALIRKQGKAKL
jgi:hypothetical protein